MAEVAGLLVNISTENESFLEENANECEPKAKKQKTDNSTTSCTYKLEDRLNGILCCTVCLDLPAKGVFQVRKQWSLTLCKIATNLTFNLLTL